MNRTGINRLTGRLVGGILLLAGTCTASHAIDRRFELDPQLLDQKIPPSREKQESPPVRKSVPKPARHRSPAPAPQAAVSGSVSQPFSLYKSTPVAVSDGGMGTVRSLWDQLVPVRAGEMPLEIREANFSLTLDPERYQMLPAADGGRIIVDGGRNLPPLVKSLIQEQQPDVRIVSESPSSGKRFYGALLQAGGFYSVEPDFTVEFGDDPRLSVRADYRIERTPESLLNGDATLLFTGQGRYALPVSLRKYLGNAGFRVVESDLPQHDIPQPRHRFVHITPGNQFQVADALLSALNIGTEVGKPIVFTGWSQQGISLTVRADRAFEFRGKSYVVSEFDGNPVNYTLMRLLETQGITVVVLGQKDDFTTITRKMLGALNLPAVYDAHRLWPLRETPYTVQVTGYLLREPGSDRTIFLTDRDMDPTFTDLLSQNGYAVSGQ